MRHILGIYHPAVVFAYFAFALVFAMLTLHPVYVMVSIAVASVYAIYLKGARRFLRMLGGAAAMFALIALFNPLFNHRGLTVLFYFLGNPVTLEALCYGLAAGGALCAVFLWFACMNEVLTNDKLLFLFGRALPSTALLLSMTLKLIPETRRRAQEIGRAQKAMGLWEERGWLPQARARARQVSALVELSMETGIDTADSMRARGYGERRRTSYRAYALHRHDLAAMAVLLALFALDIYGYAAGGAYAYYPRMQPLAGGWAQLCYALTLAFPLLLEGREWIACRLSR